MRDRQKFEEFTLPNGIRVFYYPENVGFADMRIVMHVGHMHNCNGVIPGTAHFLEHILTERSARFPEKGAFNKFVELNGGDFGASTSQFVTEYHVEVLPEIVTQAFDGLISQVMFPVFNEKDVDLHRGIVSSERKRIRWFPGKSELQQYLMTKCVMFVPTTLRQRLGYDEDLAAMTVENLRNFHLRSYISAPTVILAGEVNVDEIIRQLDDAPVRSVNLPVKYQPIEWRQREYHERAFRDVGRFEYFRQAFRNCSPTPMERTSIDFIGRMLTNSTHGTLNEWLRNKQGKTYDMGFMFSHGPNHVGWSLFLPFLDFHQVQEARKQIVDVIERALQDESFVGLEVNRRLRKQTFAFQTIGNILNGAENNLIDFGRIISQEEEAANLERCRDIQHLRRIYDKFFAPENIGEFCAVPETT